MQQILRKQQVSGSIVVISFHKDVSSKSLASITLSTMVAPSMHTCSAPTRLGPRTSSYSRFATSKTRSIGTEPWTWCSRDPASCGSGPTIFAGPGYDTRQKLAFNRVQWPEMLQHIARLPSVSNVDWVNGRRRFGHYSSKDSVDLVRYTMRKTREAFVVRISVFIFHD